LNFFSSSAILRRDFTVLRPDEAHSAKTRQPYQEPVRPTLTQAQRTRKGQRLTRELRNLGFEVTLKTKAA